MGKIGFLFEITRKKNQIIIFNKELLENDRVCVFIEKENVFGDYIATLKKRSLENTYFMYLNKNFELLPYIPFEKQKIKTGKISLNNIKIVDYKHLTFWFGVKQYKELWDFMTISDFENLEKELKMRTLKIIEYF